MLLHQRSKTMHPSSAAALLLREHATALDTRDAVPRPQTFDPQALTVEATIASRAPVRRRDQRGEFLEILDPAGLDLAATRGASVLDSHQQGGLDNVLGTIDDAWLDGNEVVARIRLSSRAEVAPLVEDIQSGIIRHLSVGYEVAQWRDGTDASGQRTRTAVKWTVREASFVPVPADHNAITRGLPGPAGARASINRQIRELCSRAGVTEMVCDDLIDRGATVEEARSAVMSELLIRGRTPIRTAHNDVTLDNPEVRIRAAGEALYLRVNPAFRASPQARQFIGLTIPEIARECLHRAAVTTHGQGADSVITRALHTTSDFPQILADTVNRTLRDSYAAAPSGIRRLARETTAADFRAKSRLMLDSSGLTLEKVNEAGEFKSGTMAEAGESYAVDSYGRIFGISRKALVNDDLGAFTDLTRRLGQAAAAFEAQFLVNLLIAQAGLGPDMSDTNPLFDVAHGNVSGTGAAPSENTLSAARLAMRKQTGPGGGLISVTPGFLLVPPDMETACEKLLTQIQATTTDDVNPFARLTLVVEPRLSSTTRWYLVADPAQIDGLEYAYLAGAPGPQTESKAGFEVDGVQVKVRLDFGAGFVDWRGWYTNAGV
jgi:hypothetical protein